MLQAIELCRRAIELAPDEAECHARLAAGLWAAGVSGWMPSGVAAIEEALALATRAINLDEGLSIGHNIMASVLIGAGRHDEAIAAAERCHELAPGDFAANSQRGQTLAIAGKYEESLPFLDRALRLSPKDPMIFWVHNSRTIALFGLERYDELITAAQRVSRQLPEWVHAHTMLAAGFMGLGELQRATQSVQAAVRLNPRLTVRRAMRQYPLRNGADAARLAAFLRDAGLAES
jgi:adenylate cyclase